MKKIVYILFVSIMILTGCSEEYALNDNEQGLDVIELPGYVAFNAPGATISIDDITTDENGDDVELNVEVQGGSLSDITVNYATSGTAVFGVDYDITGGSGTGGSFVIPHRQSPAPEDGDFVDNEDLVVDLLTDGVIDGTKTLVITLVSASNADGEEFAVGRGGTDLLKTANITINDYCVLTPVDIVGDWILDMEDSFGDGWNGASVDFEIDGVKTNYDLDSYDLDGGFTGQATITVPAGAQTLLFFFNSGDFDEEITFTITAPTGSVVGSYGPSPATGEFTVDACAL